MKKMTNKDAYGFTFWLKWILWFAGSFLFAAAFWTLGLQFLFGKIEGNELTITWAFAVFGSWFLILTPFMRKKEQIWKRLNVDEERAVSVWLAGMGFFIGLLILACVFWSFVYRTELRAPSDHLLHPKWLKAVFVSWLLLALPFLVLLYKKADEIYKIALDRQVLQQGPKFKTAFVEKKDRTLPKNLRAELEKQKPILQDGYIVTLTLASGEVVRDVFIKSGEILGLYDQTAMQFNITAVISVRPSKTEELPRYEETKWLRLDGRA